MQTGKRFSKFMFVLDLTNEHDTNICHLFSLPAICPKQTSTVIKLIPTTVINANRLNITNTISFGLFIWQSLSVNGLILMLTCCGLSLVCHQLPCALDIGATEVAN